MRQKLVGWFLAVTGFLACPCHLVITLPLAVTLLGGTALGGWIARHEGAVTVGASIYFIGALMTGGILLFAGKGVFAAKNPQAAIRGEYCPLPERSVASTNLPPDKQVDLAPVGD